MNAVKFEMTVDEEIADAMPKLRPLLGRRVEVIALETGSSAQNTKTLDDFLTHRLRRPADIEPVTLQDMEQAIAQGALGGHV